MPPLSFSTGLAGLLTDLAGWWAEVRFARPDLLWLLLLVPAFAVLNAYAARRRRAAIAALGRPGAVAALVTRPQRPGRIAAFGYSLAWALLVLGLTGPRWGRSDEGGVAVGRDVVLAIDLSRSMMADDMADRDARERWQAARAAARDLLDAVSARGGHRVGLVVFAARPLVVCPLTTDYDHVTAALAELDGRVPPPEVRPADGSVSGTRIGAGIRAAVDLHDPRFPGSQDVILISDGDDPADDREWLRGADAARKAGIPVYAVGVGNPDRPSFIQVGKDLLEGTDADGRPVGPVETRPNEAVLKAVADETRGEYLPAGRAVPKLGEFFRTRIEPRPTREVADDTIPQRKERYPWFLGPALALFAWRWAWGK